MSPPCWRSYMLVSTSRTIGYEISPGVSANSAIGPTLIIWCTVGVSASRAPAIRAIRGDHTPQQMTTLSVRISPADVETPRTWPPSTVMPVTSVPDSTVSAPERVDPPHGGEVRAAQDDRLVQVRHQLGHLAGRDHLGRDAPRLGLGAPPAQLDH